MHSSVFEKIIFPRYHQLDAVLKLTESTRKNGVGTNYLINHSNGSGKSNTIAWLSYKLFSLHDDRDFPVFDQIIVLSDRSNIVGQLEDIIKQFEQTSGIVEAVRDSKQLTLLLEKGRNLMVSTYRIDEQQAKYYF